jgi:putative transposase
VPTEDPEATALFRYAVIAEAVNQRLTPQERGQIVRELSARPHTCPDGSTRTISRNTLDRWTRAYRSGGLDALRPVVRSDTGAVRRHPELFTEAAALRCEHPARSALHISNILFARHDIRISERTLREQFRRRGLHRAALGADQRTFGRYEAARPNERWIGDVLSGPFVPHPRIAGSRKAKLFLIVDDHSRLLVHGVWSPEENARAGQMVLRTAIARRGMPDQLYLDNGAPFIAAPLARTCAVLGIRLIHSKPYAPQGRGKQERLNRVIRDQFLLEAEAVGIASFEQLNERFAAWAESVVNCRIHRETHQTPIARFQAAGPARAPDAALVAEAFRWAAQRMVTKTAMVSLNGNRYTVEPALAGRRVELRYDPEDMTRVSVWHEGLAAGVATPFVLRQHTHPAVPQAVRPPAPATGVDYLGMVLDAHTQAVKEGPISYRNLTASTEEPPS